MIPETDLKIQFDQKYLIVYIVKENTLTLSTESIDTTTAFPETSCCLVLTSVCMLLCEKMSLCKFGVERNKGEN